MVKTQHALDALGKALAQKPAAKELSAYVITPRADIRNFGMADLMGHDAMRQHIARILQDTVRPS